MSHTNFYESEIIPGILVQSLACIGSYAFSRIIWLDTDRVSYTCWANNEDYFERVTFVRGGSLIDRVAE